MHVLIVTDDAALAAPIGEYLEQLGDEPDFASDGALGLRLCEINRYDAIVVDQRLSAVESTAFCSLLREQAGSSTPVLILTRHASAARRIKEFEAGADACLDTPFSQRELYLRLRALARGRVNVRHRISAGDIHLNLERRQVYQGEVIVGLGPTGFQILELLVRCFPGVVTRSKLEQAVWGGDPPTSDAALRGHIHRLRRLLAHPSGACLIKTVHGVGYRLVLLK